METESGARSAPDDVVAPTGVPRLGRLLDLTGLLLFLGGGTVFAGLLAGAPGTPRSVRGSSKSLRLS